MKSIHGRLKEKEKAKGKSLGLNKKPNGETHTSLTLVGTG